MLAAFGKAITRDSNYISPFCEIKLHLAVQEEGIILSPVVTEAASKPKWVPAREANTDALGPQRKRVTSKERVLHPGFPRSFTTQLPERAAQLQACRATETRAGHGDSSGSGSLRSSARPTTWLVPGASQPSLQVPFQGTQTLGTDS